MSEKLKIGITHGDFNGISYEIIIKTFSMGGMNDFFTPIIYGSAKAAAYYRKALNMEHFNFNAINDANDANPKRTNLINVVSDSIKVEAGMSTQSAGISSVRALEVATSDLSAGKIDVIVTCPINKHNSYSDKHQFSGHTEYFASKFNSPEVLMFMVNERMRIGFVTGHIPISDVAKTINKDLIKSKLSIINKTLKNDFMIRAPRIAILSLNPHNGENGLLGNEEISIISPAIEESKNEMLTFGPYSPDGFFASGAFREFDAVLAMYHDQGMIPFKSIGIQGGVNYTAGLPIVRTSPAHGTAYEIAGQGIAESDSFRDALFLAAEIYSNRKQQNEFGANPLRTRANHRKKTLE